MYIVKKKDIYGNFVEMFCANHDDIAFNYYKMLKA